MQTDINTGNGGADLDLIGSVDMVAPGAPSAKKRGKRILTAPDALQILQGALKECVDSGIVIKTAPYHADNVGMILFGVKLVDGNLVEAK